MTDQTPALSAILTQRSLAPLTSPAYSSSKLSAFLAEAHQINNRLSELLTYLRSIRQPYLSSAPTPRRQQHNNNHQRQQIHLTDTQRDAIDAEAKSVLRDLHAAIANLAAAESARADAVAALAQKRNFLGGKSGFVGRWAAGGGAVEKSDKEVEEDGKRETLRVHGESVVWFLQRRLEVCGQVQGEMMEVRIRREIEKSKSVLYKSRGGSALPAFDGVGGMGNGKQANGIPLQEQLDQDATKQAQGLDDAQIQIFEKENADLLKHYESKLDQVKTVERSLTEISELQSNLAANLEIQSVNIDQLVSDSLDTTENVGKGNKELKKSSERKSLAKFVFWGTVGLCSFSVIWDLIF